MTFICYPKCSTCKKAREFLLASGLEFTERDIKLQNPGEEELREWHARSGLPLRRFFNTSGQIYRSLELTRRLPEMGEDEQYALLATDGMLVKRPILLTDDGGVLVGFRQADWERALG